MKKYKPAKLPVLITMVIVGVLFRVLYKVVDYTEEYLPFSLVYIRIPIIIFGVMTVFIILPAYYFNTYYTVTPKAVTISTGVLVTVKQLMPVTSVKSVTTILVPFGNLFGFNIVVLNAQGTNIIISFINRRDAREITDIINNEIRKRSSTGTFATTEEGADGK